MYVYHNELQHIYTYTYIHIYIYIYTYIHIYIYTPYLFLNFFKDLRDVSTKDLHHQKLDGNSKSWPRSYPEKVAYTPTTGSSRKRIPLAYPTYISPQFLPAKKKLWIKSSPPFFGVESKKRNKGINTYDMETMWLVYRLTFSIFDQWIWDQILPTGALSDMQFIAECGSSKPQQKDIAVAKG